MYRSKHLSLVYVLLAVVSLVTFLPAQQPDRCGTMPSLSALMAGNPAIASRMAAIESHTQTAIAGGRSGGGNCITIPVVVHIVWNTPAQNLSAAQIQSQIDVLNEDFRRLNVDAANTPASFLPVAADSEIEFCLASVDPQGGATIGITRTQSSVTVFSSQTNNVKFTNQGGKDAWPRDQYLNIWVAPLGQSLLGYAQFPGGAAATDGIVCTSFAFGRTGTLQPGSDRGRTTTHEIGHWLNLRHIWGDGPCGQDDFVTDTPESDAPNYGCQTGSVSCGSVDMVQNYMDYSNDSCMNLFTQGQKARMRALFAPGGFREPLLSSPGCGGTAPPPPPPAASYQVNQARSGLNLDGVNGTTTTPAVTTVPAGGQTTLQLSSALFGAPFEVFITLSPLVARGQGAYVTPTGQIVNMSLADPTFFWINGGGANPAFIGFPGNFTAPIFPTSQGTAALQQIVGDPTNPDGYVLSQGCQLDVTAGQGGGVTPTFPQGPTGDDDNVTVDLVGQGYDYSIRFYGTVYTQLHVSSNGRVVFGSPDTAYLATPSGAATGNPFVGFWTDLDPTLGGNITITSPAPGKVRIDWNGVPYWGEPFAPVTFGIELDSNNDSVRLENLLSVPANPQVFNFYSGQNQFLGMSPGGNAASFGTTMFGPGGSGSMPGNAMLYDFFSWTGFGGLATSFYTNVDAVQFPPAGSGYSWAGS